MTIFRKPLELVPPLNSLANIARSVINQDYTGDINIIRPPRYWSPTKILSDLSQDDIDDLIDTGRRTDRKSTRLTPVTNAHLVCRLRLEKKNTNNQPLTQDHT